MVAEGSLVARAGDSLSLLFMGEVIMNLFYKFSLILKESDLFITVVEMIEVFRWLGEEEPPAGRYFKIPSLNLRVRGRQVKSDNITHND